MTQRPVRARAAVALIVGLMLGSSVLAPAAATDADDLEAWLNDSAQIFADLADSVEQADAELRPLVASGDDPQDRDLSEFQFNGLGGTTLDLTNGAGQQFLAFWQEDAPGVAGTTTFVDPATTTWPDGSTLMTTFELAEPFSSCAGVSELDVAFVEPDGTPLAIADLGDDYPLNGTTTVAAAVCVEEESNVGLFESDGAGLAPVAAPPVIAVEWIGPESQSFLTIIVPQFVDPFTPGSVRGVASGATDPADPLTYAVQSTDLTEPTAIVVPAADPDASVAPSESAAPSESETPSESAAPSESEVPSPGSSAAATTTQDEGGGVSSAVVVGGILGVIVVVVLIALILKARQSSNVVTQGDAPPPLSGSEELRAAGVRSGLPLVDGWQRVPMADAMDFILAGSGDHQRIAFGDNKGYVAPSDTWVEKPPVDFFSTPLEKQPEVFGAWVKGNVIKVGGLLSPDLDEAIPEEAGDVPPEEAGDTILGTGDPDEGTPIA